MSSALVVTTNQEAADAGASALAAGGNAVDAAVATALAMCVVDPANCGLGGYGGFLVWAAPGERPVQVDFNTWVASRFSGSFASPGETERFVSGGASVAPPSVVRGLLAARDRLGRLPLAELVRPAVRLAADGFLVGRDLAAALEKHRQRAVPAFASIFYPRGRAPGPGDRLVQPELAATLELIAEQGVDGFARGPVAEAICGAVRADGGFLEAADLAEDRVVVGPAEETAFATAVVYGPRRSTSGAGVLFDALERIEVSRLGDNRLEPYVGELTRALRRAWEKRLACAGRVATLGHTTHLSASDAAGGCAALTLTHGPLDFGSGLVAPRTGVVLNAGVNLFAPSDDGPQAIVNMCPIVIEEARGARHALGATGGPRIPAMLLSAVVDVVHYRRPLSAAIAAPHLAVRAADGLLEAEAGLIADALPLTAGVSFGPVCGVTVADGEATPGVDPRFDSGVA